MRVIAKNEIKAGETKFDSKEFTRWWEKCKENEPELDRKIEEALIKAKTILSKNVNK